jgi:hypothetical protein
MLRFGDTYYSVVVKNWGAPKSELLLQVMCLRTAPVLPTKRTETSVGLDFVGNFRQALLASFEHNGDSAQFELFVSILLAAS